jgi:hypothetical protein
MNRRCIWFLSLAIAVLASLAEETNQPAPADIAVFGTLANTAASNSFTTEGFTYENGRWAE